MSPWQLPAFRWLWCSTLASTAGQGMERTATAWLALQAGGGAFAVGLVLAARMLPSLLFGLAAGTVADRIDRRRQLLAVGGAICCLMAAASWWIRSGPVYVWQVVAIAFALGCLQVFDTPARQALVLDTVRAEAAQRALALNALASRLALAFGALIAGALIPRGGVPSCYLAIAVASGLAAVLAVPLRVPRQRRGRLAHPPFLRALREAARLVIDIPAVRTLSSAGIACEIFAFSHSSALPIVAEDVLRAGAEGLGTLNAAVALGGTVAVTLLSLLPERVRREPLLGAVFVGYGLALLALSAMRALALAAVVLVVIGLCAGAFDVLQQTLIQLAVPDDQRGRAVGIWILGLGSAPFGHLEMGLLAANLGAPEALLINGAVTVVAASLLTRVPDYRWNPRPRPMKSEP